MTEPTKPAELDDQELDTVAGGVPVTPVPKDTVKGGSNNVKDTTQTTSGNPNFGH